MPWKECSVMDERLQFVARRLAGEQMADLCREFGISRKTGYKIFDRYKECGVQGLTEKPAPPSLCAQATLPNRELHPERQARAHHLGCTKDSRAPDPQILRDQNSGQEHHPCAARSPRLCRAPRSCTTARARNSSLVRSASQRTLVYRLQRRVLARKSSVWLSADGHRPCQPFSSWL
jgi:hypothetical protein